MQNCDCEMHIEVAEIHTVKRAAAKTSKRWGSSRDLRCRDASDKHEKANDVLTESSHFHFLRLGRAVLQLIAKVDKDNPVLKAAPVTVMSTIKFPC